MAGALCHILSASVWAIMSVAKYQTLRVASLFCCLESSQEVVIEGQDKVFKDVIEPLENVSVNLFPTNKQDIRDFGPPQEVSLVLLNNQHL